MSEYSLVIRNAQIVDGTGRTAFPGDVAVANDRIQKVGKVSGRGRLEIDARQQVAAPGFIDIHTHYDPQLCWDRTVHPSPRHGVTSVVIGNCSVSLAPVRKGDRDKVIKWFGAVEDMESGLLAQTVSFAWETFAEYLGELRNGGIAVNVGAFVGHALLRAYVMGDDAQRREATEVEINMVADELRRSLQAGALGLSFTYAHLDEAGQELPCMYAGRPELAVLLRVVAEAQRMVEVSVNLRAGADPFEQIELFGALALETGATCSLSPILVLPNPPDRWRRMLERIEAWRERGAPVFSQAQVRSMDMLVNLANGSLVLSKTPLWRQFMEKPAAGKLEMIKDPANRKRLADEIEHEKTIRALIEVCLVKRVKARRNECYVGRSV
ncbi:MAG: amidohydrolase family protein, partial [Steroidobacteraceae bacterium]